jgi:hypothetical protein
MPFGTQNMSPGSAAGGGDCSPYRLEATRIRPKWADSGPDTSLHSLQRLGHSVGVEWRNSVSTILAQATVT